MSNTKLIQTLERFARSDLKKARNGGVIVAQTKLGSLDIQYDASTEYYTVIALLDGQRLSVGPASQTRDLLVSAYDVVTE